MLSLRTVRQCTDEIVAVISKYTSNVIEAKGILDQINIDQYSKISIEDNHGQVI